MMKINNEKKCLASLAVFRELYDNDKDIYRIIGEFLKEVITSQGKYQFTSTEMTQLLNDCYDFDIPEAIISTSLKRFKNSYTIRNGIYTITDKSSFKNTESLTDKQVGIQHVHNAIIDNLFSFIETEQKQKIAQEEKEKIVNSFVSFLIDETNTQEYSEYISAFIIKSKQNIDFITQLKTIKEGIVLYTGLKYNSNLNEIGTWKTELTIYLETEILFHLAGYNGILYQTLFNDFHNFVKEINIASQKKGNKRLIKLKYFTEVKDEIDGFFKTAESIVNGKKTANPAKTAMTSIINGCTSPSDVIEKKTQFYTLLRDNLIIEDDYSRYYSQENHKFNIENEELLENLSVSLDLDIDDVAIHLRFLNFINIHRRGISNKGFEQISYILLTGTSKTLAIAWDESIKQYGNVPLASDLGFLTNKFWFNLNKGFGTTDYPKSFDIITKAQIVLSSQLNNSVSDKFDELLTKYKNGQLTEEQAVSTIAELRKEAKTPENINETDIEDVLKSINESSIEVVLKEQELFKHQAIQTEEENKKLKSTLEQSELEKQKIEKEYNEQLAQKEIEMQETENELKKYRDAEITKQENSKKRKRLLKRILYLVMFLFFICAGVCLYIYCNTTLGIITGTLAGICTILAFFGVDAKKVKKIF